MKPQKLPSNPFQIGDRVIIRKPLPPFPAAWPSEYKNTYAFGIPEKAWNKASHILTNVSALMTYENYPAVMVDLIDAYCWPVECVYKYPWTADLVKKGKIPCNCPNIFLQGCQDKKNHI
jgi:hypothetical protein